MKLTPSSESRSLRDPARSPEGPRRPRRRPVWLAHTFLILAAGCGALTFFAAGPPSQRFFEIAKNLDIYASLYKEVNQYYVDDVDPGKLMRKGIEAMLQGLDPYTNYIGEEEKEDFLTATTGQYGGIGASIGRRNNKHTVLMPYEGFAAHKAGLLIGDEVLEVDGVEVSGKSTQEMSRLLKGQAGTKVRLKVRRVGQPAPVTVEMARQHIRIENVPYSGMIAPTVGYLELTDFTSEASREMRQTIQTLKEKGAQSLVIDLRDNPGGLLNEAINISNLFLPRDLEVVSTKGKVQEWNKTYRSTQLPLDTTIPIVVLINGRSASAAEIVSGVLQDYDRAVLVGQRTFGKGLVQITRPLSYNNQLKVTTARYYIPSGRCIQAIDYAHRGSDGRPGRIPDSLRMAFRTRGGRIVYDGGGVTPDIDLKARQLTPIAQSLLAKGLIFDYATEYRAKNPTLPPAGEFKVREAEYKAFTKWLGDKDYDYTTRVETSINELEEHARKENYLGDIKDQIEALRRRMSHNKDHDLEKNRPEIAELLEEEIVSRYYWTKGRKVASFDDDPEIRTALEVLADKGRYQKLLARAN